jgi:hypothetical protein
MIIDLNAVHWGPQFKVPTISIKKYCGHVLLRENLDDELLKKELEKGHSDVDQGRRISKPVSRFWCPFGYHGTE